MKPVFFIELDRQLYLPGEEITGKVVLDSPGFIKIDNIRISFKGTEVLGTKNFWYMFSVPIVDEERALYATNKEKEDVAVKSGEYPFGFTVPSNSPPSFKSADFGCEYILNARLDLGLGKHISAKNHITVVPNAAMYPKNYEVEFGVSNNDILFRCFLEKEYFFTGDNLRGNYHIEYPADNPLRSIEFKIEAEGVSLDKDFPFTEKIWESMKAIDIKPGVTQSSGDNFFFAIPDTAPPSGLWNTFRVYWTVSAKVTLSRGESYTAKAYFDVFKFYDKFWEEVESPQK
ncbi:MAG: hypothetical protein ABIH00_05635 [Armatimonadota bacterium]